MRIDELLRQSHGQGSRRAAGRRFWSEIQLYGARVISSIVPYGEIELMLVIGAKALLSVEIQHRPSNGQP